MPEEDQEIQSEQRAEQTAVAESAQPEEPKTFDADYVKKLRAEAAKYRTDLKSLREKATKYDELTESQKSELQKAQEQAAAAQKELEQARTESIRLRVAASKGLPGSIAERLRGSTQEEMEADADALLEEINRRYVAKSAPSRAETGAGVAGKAPDYDSMTPKQLVEMVRNRSK